jgi:hypothetical protein
LGNLCIEAKSDKAECQGKGGYANREAKREEGFDLSLGGSDDGGLESTVELPLPVTYISRVPG